MSRSLLFSRPGRLLQVAPSLLALALAGCAVGPDFVRPTPDAPGDWTQWHGGDDSLRPTVEGIVTNGPWWKAYGDPVLEVLQRRAQANSPDLKTAALHLAQARVQRLSTKAQTLPEVDLSAGVTRQRQSENGASTRLVRAIGGDQTDSLTQVLSEPFTLYQAGVDVSWEPDLWGRIRRSIEASDADVQQQAALLDLTRLSISDTLASAYFDLRTTQQRIAIARDDIKALQARMSLLEARLHGGVIDHLDTSRQHTELAALEATLPALLAQENSDANQLALLVGERPGALADVLQPVQADAAPALPDLALGLPSELARRRPDIRAAEAALHSATANIGIARADLYPSVRLGAKFGYESYQSGVLTDWGSRTWSVGPSLDLPIFDHGRRVRVVQLRQLQQQEAAVEYQKTVLQAWKEIDDALASYASLRQRDALLREREASAKDAWTLVNAKYDAGVVDFLSVIDSQRSYLQARNDLAQNRGQLQAAFAHVNLAAGNLGGEDDDPH
ncbi:efflux transporter outer membrane subunit [Pseudoxanthomonas sp.]|uniref:efflux transporter outer membrane subunit n=1 Tax=Pseudoxanthomonas sp. TaxID=1871049 RepID=UPI00260A9D6D|nr:efflux transporter outer membrane subunit [Pseudoxanthomonas sp.]WDS34799.1 MAG: efflux transporter outer membrane subunit [Pseudoxanthomonas sp.]